MTSAFQYAHASNRQIDKLLNECAQQLSGPFTQQLGIIYITDALHDQFPVISNYLKDLTAIPHWVGTVGMGIIGGDTEYYDEPAIAVMLCDIDADDFAIMPALIDNLEPFITLVENWHLHNSLPFGLLHADPSNSETQLLLQQLHERITNTQFIGGLTSSRGSLPQLSDRLTSGGLSGVLFSDNVSIVTNLSQGCTPIGPVRNITQSERNLVITLDNEPALDIFKQDIGEVLARDIQRTSGYIFAGIPTDSEHPDDYMIRNIIGVDENHGIFAIGDFIKDEQQLMFCRRDGNTAQKDMTRMLDEIKQQLNSTPRGGVYISCIGRGRHQFGDHSEEVAMIHKTLGDFPLIGFYANGEIFNANLYSFTGVLMLFE